MNKNTAKYIRSFMKGVIAFTLTIVTMSGCSSSQSVASSNDETIYDNDSVTVKADFPGGKQAYRIYLNNNFIRSGFGAKQEEEGIGIYSFIVNKDGKIKKVKTVQNVSNDCDLTMLRLLQKMPKWKPASLNGKPVNVRVEVRLNVRMPHNRALYDTPPYFPGGTETLQSLLTAYSEDERGSVRVRIIVDEEGNVKEPKIVKGLSYHADRIALGLVAGLPKWVPATKNGKPIRTTRTVVVYFERY